MKAILYELNEVPWRVFDWYVAERPTSNLARLLREGRSYSTVCDDVGELHPWSTWPSLHLGVSNVEHGLTFINQKIQSSYRTTWEILAGRGVRVGVFGSLQSHERFPEDLHRYAFYIPDTFSPTPKCHPNRYSSFQRLNLRMTQRDGAIAKTGIPADPDYVASLWGMMKTGLSVKTMRRAAQQLSQEFINEAYRTRRSVLQAPVAFDIFLHAYRTERPEYSTFFTNHVAGMMHRYWHATFPTDFADSSPREDPVRQSNISYAMDIADEQVGVLMHIAERDGAALLLATSMGQEAIVRRPYWGELRLTSLNSFTKAIGFNGVVHLNLAMQPDFALVFEGEDDCCEFETKAGAVTDENGEAIFWFKRSGNTLNLNVRPTMSVMSTKRIFVRDAGERRSLGVGEAGFEEISRDPGTGYHQPEGCFVFWNGGSAGPKERESISLSQVCPTILRLFGGDGLDYMAEGIAPRVLLGS